MIPREKTVEDWLGDRVRELGGVYFKFTSPGSAGVPDRIAIFPDGRLVFIELKSSGGKLRKLQKYQAQRLVRMNQQVAVVYGKAGAKDFFRDMKEHVTTSLQYFGDGETDEI